MRHFFINIISFILTMLVGVSVAQAKLASGCFDPTGVAVNDKLTQTWRIFTNAISSPFTATAMALGTSGCKTNGFVKSEVEADMFVASFNSELENELARGGGEHLLAWSTLLGCNSNVIESTQTLEQFKHVCLAKAQQ